MLPNYLLPMMGHRNQSIIFALPYGAEERDAFELLSSPRVADLVQQIVNGVGDGRHFVGGVGGYSPRTLKAIGDLQKLIGDVSPRPEMLAYWQAACNYAEK